MRTIQNAKISDVTLKIERGFALSSWIFVDYKGSGQGFGGYVLGKKDEHNIPSYCSLWIMEVLRIADVEDWNDLVGRPIRVDTDHGKIYGIGHFIKDEWFYPEDEFSKLSKGV